jgi:hypothetical protein
LTKPENVAKALAEVPVGFRGVLGGAGGNGEAGRSRSDNKQFTPAEVEEIMRAAATSEMKEVLKATTQTALDRGAFGNPWLWVTNGDGKSEAFFGSDR